MQKHAVVIVGGGPTGLMLAAELALAHVDVVIVERRATQELAGARAGGLHARTIEVLDQRGVAERFVSQGQTHPFAFFSNGPIAIGDLPTRHNYVLGLSQNRIEPILADWVAELGVPILRGRDVTGFVQDERGVDVALSGGTSLRADYLVGCDGGRSAIRKIAGIDFAGWDASVSYLIAEGEMTNPTLGFRRTDAGIHAIGKLDDGRVRFVLCEPEVGHGDPTMRELKDRLTAIYGADYDIRNVTWLSRFSDMARQAASYRSSKVLLAGDAAHIHSPVGGQGLNLGMQDAVNLGWKLARVVHGTSPDTLLDSYHAERHPVGARVIRTTMAGTALRRGDERTEALREMMTDLVRTDEPRRRIGAMLIGLDIRYDFGEGHPLLGRRMPDLELADGTRVYTRLHDATPLLLHFGEPGAIHAHGIRVIDARYEGAWVLPVIGEVSAPPAVLIRPDGHVAWAGGDGLDAAIARWFGGQASTNARP